ncbi:hypothetical protein PIB30_046719 [Stylosanthes scabra]|uniref:CRC domain-containing protein n=1 Tax=Stylosanthes scabra TaxID=79078 RepID=A0ABU6ZF95_9FABA|nr:hypothetical protein [Stylosanthes scabra]
MASCEDSGNNMNEGASDTISNPSHGTSSMNDSNGKCNCMKSQCVKLYCQCFSAGNFCNDNCSCKNCLNNEVNKDSVNQIKKEIQSRDPRAFEPKVIVDQGARNRKGCICRKSECKKNYCSCFAFKVGCSRHCQCQNCMNEYGVKGSSSGAKEQERVNDSNNGSKNVETMDNGSSSQSHHPPPPVYDNSPNQLSENSNARADDELGNSNVNNIPMPMPSNQVASPYHNFAVQQNHVAAPYYYRPLTPVHIQSSRNNITEQQSTNLFGDPDWQGQSTFLRTNPPFYYDNNVAELSSIPRIQSSHQYLPHQSHGFHQQVEEAPLGAMTLQLPFLRSSQQPNNGDGTNMQLNLHPHLHGHGPSPPPTADYEENHHHGMFLLQNNRPQ